MVKLCGYIYYAVTYHKPHRSENVIIKQSIFYINIKL